MIIFKIEIGLQDGTTREGEALGYADLALKWKEAIKQPSFKSFDFGFAGVLK
jgi:hypothetical protein